MYSIYRLGFLLSYVSIRWTVQSRDTLLLLPDLLPDRPVLIDPVAINDTHARQLVFQDQQRAHHWGMGYMCEHWEHCGDIACRDSNKEVQWAVAELDIHKLWIDVPHCYSLLVLLDSSSLKSRLDY
jgi:hypothetical protein